MTLRARPVARRRGRAGWDPGDRRNSLINLGFFLAIGLSLIILIGYAGWSWYDSHFGAAATVNGKVITKDELIGRLKIENFRLDYIESRIQTLMAKGRIDQGDGQQQIDFINQRRQQLANLTLERLVDNALQGMLASENGVEASDADIDKQLLDEATTSEQRHVWMIEIDPVLDPKTGEVSEAQKRAALIRAREVLARLAKGDSWEDVARTDNDSAFAPQSGDLGWLAKDSGYDDKFMAAVFAGEVNKTTDIIEGGDGALRIGRFTESAPEEIDSLFQSSIEDAGIKLADYRLAAKGDVLRRKLSEKIVADLSQPSPQRHVLTIFLPEPNEPSTQDVDGVKVRWIVYAPNDDTGKAKDVPADDPAWAKAKADADAANAALKADPRKFDKMARDDSDERSAEFTGGKQPWIYPTTSIDGAIRTAVLADGLTNGQLLEPIKGDIGWYVIQFMRPTGDGETAYLKTLKNQGTAEANFRQMAIDNSEGENAKDGGDMGWIARYQLSDQLDKAIFDTPIGATSEIQTISGTGDSLYLILKEETRAPDEEQLKAAKDSGFDNWYSRQKDNANIDYNLGSSSGTA
jgi:parvulin-like peptidyl-prolyl isomerase